MQLSERMQRLAALVTAGNRLADVGTDHGYIPIALVQEGKIPSALAMDINQGPLARAEAHIRQAGLSTYIKTRLSDGLLELRKDEADTVLAAGMGGMLILRILDGGGHCLRGIKELILQPQSDIPKVRKRLAESGWQIIDEDIAFEDGKYYPMMKAVHGQERSLSSAELYYGKPDVQRSPKVLLSFLYAKQKEEQKILATLQKNGKEHTDRAEEIRECMKMTNDMLRYMEGRGNFTDEMR